MKKLLIVTVFLISFMVLNLFAASDERTSDRIRESLLTEFQLPAKTQSNILDLVAADLDNETEVINNEWITRKTLSIAHHASHTNNVEDLKKTTIRYYHINTAFESGARVSYYLVYDLKSKFLTLRTSVIKAGYRSSLIAFVDEKDRKDPSASIKSKLGPKNGVAVYEIPFDDNVIGFVSYYDFYTEFLK